MGNLRDQVISYFLGKMSREGHEEETFMEKNTEICGVVLVLAIGTVNSMVQVVSAIL